MCSLEALLLVLCGLWAAGAALARPLLGAQRWDMYSGDLKWTGQQELGFVAGGPGFLAPLEWHHRAPVFCRPQPSNRRAPLVFNHPFEPSVLQAAMDAEIEYAFGAGLDFWIFNTPARSLVGGGSAADGTGAWDLHNNLDAYLKHTGARKPKFVTALFGFSALNYSRSSVDVMLDEVLGYMQLPHWQVSASRPAAFPSSAQFAIQTKRSVRGRRCWTSALSYRCSSRGSSKQIWSTRATQPSACPSPSSSATYDSAHWRRGCRTPTSLPRARATAPRTPREHSAEEVSLSRHSPASLSYGAQDLSGSRSIERLILVRPRSYYKAGGFDAMSDYQAGYGGAMCERGACPSYKQATESLLRAYRSRFDAAAQDANISYVPPMDNQM